MLYLTGEYIKFNNKKMDKKFSLLTAVLLVTSFAFGEAHFINSDQKEHYKAGSASILPEVRKILQNSCFDCHSKGGKKKALSHLNFSEWDNYPDDKKEKKSEEIVAMLKKGAMPPKLYRQSHPEKIPSPYHISLISQWAENLKRK